jgi:hypothetical protein
LDDKEASFDANRTPATPLIVDGYFQAAREVASQLGSPAAWAGCDAPAPSSCLEAWLPGFLERVQRRPASADELALFQPLLAGTDRDDAVRAIVEVALQSPGFLYHLEAREAGAAFGVASRLASLLWASVPDEELLAAARSGALLTPAARRRQAERMLADPRSIAGIGTFHVQWLEVDVLPTLEKEASVVDGWSPSLIENLLDEVRSLSAFFVRQGDGRLATLLSAPVVQAPADALASIYGLAGPSRVEPQHAPLAAPGRSGLLTTGAFLATHAHRDQTSPTKRGFVIRDRFFCQKPVPPPPDVNNAPPALDPNATTKERFAAHTENAACAGCHAITDPIGWGFEGFDAAGRVRRSEAGRPIDDEGVLTGTDVDGSFVGVRGLAAKLSASGQVEDCVTTQWVRYALRRHESAAEQCQLDALRASFRASGGDLRSLLLSIAESTLLVQEAP